ncbi:hypothetical protein GcM1_132008 [Golovinomyces cichoracearum]|uniref:Uncharacterized protein n=1 Tax=Golovinomyces cichoracearum TaxID=62708 RepID=A0A420JBQ8_9PEZI|nr:hypothetical protein GcM1_132008 [Golovinomyces cichoracearum]
MKLAIIVIAQLVSIVTAESAEFFVCEKSSCAPLVRSDAKVLSKNVFQCKICHRAGEAGQNLDKSMMSSCVTVVKKSIRQHTRKYPGQQTRKSPEQQTRFNKSRDEYSQIYVGGLSETGLVDNWTIATDLRQEYSVTPGTEQFSILTENGEVDAKIVGGDDDDIINVTRHKPRALCGTAWTGQN